MNGPTILTLLRVALIPIIVAFTYLPTPFSTWASLAVFLLASATDWLDGYLARRNNQITTLGKLLDPLADKLLVLTAFIVLLERESISGWIAIILIGREMAITGLRSFLAAEGVVLAASRLGKWKMTFQVISLSFLFIDREHEWFRLIGVACLYLALFFSLLSAYFYVRKCWQKLGDKFMAEQGRKGKSNL